jgi:hypothetical protein
MHLCHRIQMHRLASAQVAGIEQPETAWDAARCGQPVKLDGSNDWSIWAILIWQPTRIQ